MVGAGSVALNALPRGLYYQLNKRAVKRYGTAENRLAAAYSQRPADFL
jgi:hypothetical protein